MQPTHQTSKATTQKKSKKYSPSELNAVQKLLDLLVVHHFLSTESFWAIGLSLSLCMSVCVTVFCGTDLLFVRCLSVNQSVCFTAYNHGDATKSGTPVSPLTNTIIIITWKSLKLEELLYVGTARSAAHTLHSLLCKFKRTDWFHWCLVLVGFTSILITNCSWRGTLNECCVVRFWYGWNLDLYVKTSHACTAQVYVELCTMLLKCICVPVSQWLKHFLCTLLKTHKYGCCSIIVKLTAINCQNSDSFPNSCFLWCDFNVVQAHIHEGRRRHCRKGCS